MPEGESSLPREPEQREKDVLAYRRFFFRVFPTAEEILIDEGNIEEVKGVVSDVFSNAVPYLSPLPPGDQRSVTKHLAELRQRNIHYIRQKSAFTDQDVRFLRGSFGLEAEKKTVKQLAREEKLLGVRVENRINQAKKVLRYARFAVPLRQYARFPPTPLR